MTSILIASDKYGCDGTVTFAPYYVRVVKDTDLFDFLDKKKRGNFEAKYNHVDEKHREELFFLMRLGKAIIKQDKGAINNAVESYLESSFIIKNDRDVQSFYHQLSCWLHELKVRTPINVLNREINKWLKKAHFVLWRSQRERKLKTGLFCSDIGTALFTLWISNLEQRRGINICSRCSAPFVNVRTTQKYCSHKCQNAACVARYRKNKKAK